MCHFCIWSQALTIIAIHYIRIQGRPCQGKLGATSPDKYSFQFRTLLPLASILMKQRSGQYDWQPRECIVHLWWMEGHFCLETLKTYNLNESTIDINEDPTIKGELTALGDNYWLRCILQTRNACKHNHIDASINGLSEQTEKIPLPCRCLIHRNKWNSWRQQYLSPYYGKKTGIE